MLEKSTLNILPHHRMYIITIRDDHRSARVIRARNRVTDFTCKQACKRTAQVVDVELMLTVTVKFRLERPG